MPMGIKMNIYNRYWGAILGLAIGDALGATIEFSDPETFEPVNDMVGGGPFHLGPGEWTDDTSMTLCLAQSLIDCRGFDPVDQMNKYVQWYRHGYMSSNGRCFDIGITTSAALVRYQKSGNPFSGSSSDTKSGNGSLMRLAPMPLFYAKDPEKAIVYAGESSRTTHASRIAIDACRYYSSLITAALHGISKDELLSEQYCVIPNYWSNNPLIKEVAEIANGSFKQREPPEIIASGYVVKTLEAALWAFNKSSNFRDGCLLAINLGNDADTVGAIYGQLAGAYYGKENLPENWCAKIALKEVIEQIAKTLYSITHG